MFATKMIFHFERQVISLLLLVAILDCAFCKTSETSVQNTSPANPDAFATKGGHIVNVVTINPRNDHQNQDPKNYATTDNSDKKARGQYLLTQSANEDDEDASNTYEEKLGEENSGSYTSGQISTGDVSEIRPQDQFYPLQNDDVLDQTDFPFDYENLSFFSKGFNFSSSKHPPVAQQKRDNSVSGEVTDSTNETFNDDIGVYSRETLRELGQSNPSLIATSHSLNNLLQPNRNKTSPQGLGFKHEQDVHRYGEGSRLDPISESPLSDAKSFSSLSDALPGRPNVSSLLDRLMEGYDKRLRPGFGGTNHS